MDINRTEDIAGQSEDDFKPEYKIYKAIKKGKECWRTHIYDEYALVCIGMHFSEKEKTREALCNKASRAK